MDTVGRTRRIATQSKLSIRRLFASLTVKLVFLIGIFAALPVALYWQVEKADRATRELLATSIRQRSWLTAQALIPKLSAANGVGALDLNATLRQFALEGTTLKLVFQPNAADGARGFFFVAAAPVLTSQNIAPELDVLQQQGILDSLGVTCGRQRSVDYRYQAESGAEALMTSITPIETAAGCWILISTHSNTALLHTAIGQPYWKTEYIRLAGAVYLMFGILAALIALSFSRALRRFRRAANEIRRGTHRDVSFSERNTIPELSSVARDFDHLVDDLRRTAVDIRQTAEQNAHAIKTPLAVIRSALEPVKRCAKDLDDRSRRAIELIDSSLTRLNALTSAAQRIGNDAADFILAPKRRINLTNILFDALHSTHGIAAERGVRLVHQLDRDVHILAPDGVLEIVVENILDNALSFSRHGGKIVVSLAKGRQRAVLSIEDDGPGVDPGKIGRVFDRKFSSRPPGRERPVPTESSQEPTHAGLGLWIVRRYVEGLGGTVTAANRVGGGFCVHITLPSNGH